MADEQPIGIPESAIALFAHPDDPEFLAGGTIAKWTDAGCEVSYVIMTDGRAGDMGLRDDPNPISEAELVARRQEEQRAAGAILGVTDITFFDYHDGELMHTLDAEQLAHAIIAKSAPPDIVTTNMAYVKEGALLIDQAAVDHWKAHGHVHDHEIEKVRYTSTLQGLSSTALNGGQQELLLALVG